MGARRESMRHVRFAVADEVFAAVPGLRIALVIAEGAKNDGTNAAVEQLLTEAWQSAGVSAAEFGNAQSHPRVAPWRETFRQIGVSGRQFPSSIEALLRRALKGGEPVRVNPLVDFYNAISLRHIVPAGGFDLDALPELIELRMTRAGDRFRALGEESEIDVSAGEIAYASDSTILTRHIVWRQSECGLITTRTSRVMLVSETLGALGPGVAETVREEFARGLQEFFGVSSRTWIVSADSPDVEW